MVQRPRLGYGLTPPGAVLGARLGGARVVVHHVHETETDTETTALGLMEILGCPGFGGVGSLEASGHDDLVLGLEL